MYAVAVCCGAQTSNLAWTMQESGTTASLRGIASVDGRISWASGSGGTVLRTTDGGAHWTRCAVPDAEKDGAKLDFRGVQAWDAQTAIVMASGPGDKSRLYKTSDGCKSWKLLFKNPDKLGFWDSLYFENGQFGWLLGDPVRDEFTLYHSGDAGGHWTRQHNGGLHVKSGSQSAFAASNSSLVAIRAFTVFGSGGTDGASVYSLTEVSICLDDCSPSESNRDGSKNKWARQIVPLGESSVSSGVFSIGSRGGEMALGLATLVAVGGDYSHPGESRNTAAWLISDSKIWTASSIPPHGFRSAVAWSEELKAWITVGTNGSDISRDDGKTWTPMPDPEVPGGNWNALSLPFVVGPNGRIARLTDAKATGIEAGR
jgi:photosystem II stability/assembly factor-like uncharacterized protein